MKWIDTLDQSAKTWRLFLYFGNEPKANQRLLEAYLSMMSTKDAQKLAYQNTSKFIYFLQQGEIYFRTAKQSERMVQPLLLYYGMISMLKALLLFKDPHYPKSTSVLQHGLTTRKKKKLHYLFQEDEVKVQKDGLIPHFAKVYLNQALTIHQKYKVSHLLTSLPELDDCCRLLWGGRGANLESLAAELDELIVFNMIMYVLSMLCRYDTEAWGEILFSFGSSELYVIEEFLNLTFLKYPSLILDHLFAT